MLSEQYFPRIGEKRELFVEDVSVSFLAEKFGTPLYVYSKGLIVNSFLEFKEAFSYTKSIIAVSVKANSNLSLLSLLAKKGAGFDIVSGGELQRVIAAGGDLKLIVFAGVGKTDEEITFALEQGILMFNVESLEELKRIDELAGKLQKGKAPVALRVNPNVDAKTHAYISTGMEEHKFGISLPDALKIYKDFKNFPNISFVGIDCHIGSMISDMSAFKDAFLALRNAIGQIKECTPSLSYVDIGGGLAVSYKSDSPPSIAKYAEAVKEALKGFNGTLICEPGRAIFANAGLLVSKVIYTKSNSKKRFIIVDAGFNDLIRPALYQAYHEIVPVFGAKPGEPRHVADVVGPICESGDCFAKGRELPPFKRDDLLVFCSAGAYSFSMASNYNTRPRPAEVLVDGKDVYCIKPRESIEAILADEIAALGSI